MRKMIALLVSIAFSLGVAGFAVAAEEKRAPTSAEKKAAMDKEMADKKAECLQKATTDKEKAACEKTSMKHTKKASKTTTKKEPTTAEKKDTTTTPEKKDDKK